MKVAAFLSPSMMAPLCCQIQWKESFFCKDIQVGERMRGRSGRGKKNLTEATLMATLFVCFAQNGDVPTPHEMALYLEEPKVFIGKDIAFKP